MSEQHQNAQSEDRSAHVEGLRIALIGSRGIPANYGGYETLMEELATRLVAAGHRVTVYCRSRYTDRKRREYRGVDLVVLPTIPTKHLDTPVHTLLSCLHAVFRRYDAALVVNGANAAFVPLLRLSGIPTALHVDGIESQRAKWGRLGRWVYRSSERLATVVANEIVSDAEVIRQHYLSRYGKSSTLIRYGVEPKPPESADLLRRLGLEPGHYFLYVSRFEPENNPHRVCEAYRRVGSTEPLVMVGGAPYAHDFVRSFTEGADRRILFPGPIYGDGYRQLLSNAHAYIHATEVGGTHPALVEAMGYGNCIVVNDVPENREAAGDEALYFTAGEPETLALQLDWVREHETDAATCGEAMRKRAAELFSWQSVTAAYIELFASLAEHRPAAS